MHAGKGLCAQSSLVKVDRPTRKTPRSYYAVNLSVKKRTGNLCMTVQEENKIQRKAQQNIKHPSSNCIDFLNRIEDFKMRGSIQVN